jgi:hypothetical protein
MTMDDGVRSTARAYATMLEALAETTLTMSEGELMAECRAAGEEPRRVAIAGEERVHVRQALGADVFEGGGFQGRRRRIRRAV